MSLKNASATRHGPTYVMTAGFAAMASINAVLAIVLAGCDSTAILPPPPPELDNSVEAHARR